MARAVRLASILTALVAAAYAAGAQADSTDAWESPTLSTIRYDEDWSGLANQDRRDSHWTGQFKYIPLGDDGSLTTGVELRARNEDFTNNLWGSADAPDDGYLWLRALPYADLRYGRLRAFVQPIASTSLGVAPSPGPIDGSGVEALQGFVEADLGHADLRVGRQMLLLGTERLVGTRYGPNVPLAFDGFRADVKLGSGKVSLLAVKPVQALQGSFNDRTSPTKSLWGAYATVAPFDVYYLGYRNTEAAWVERNGVETRHSLGLRYYGEKRDWRWNFEAVYQFGHFAHGPISAWTLASEVGRAFPHAPLAPELLLRANITSGDGKRDDDRLGTFNALFPKGKYFGELSPIGPYNMFNAYSSVTVHPATNVTAGLAAMAYWRYSLEDGVYDIPGSLIRDAGTSRARYIGHELEATLVWQASPELELSTSLSAFEAGGFIKETGPASTIRMIGFESNFRF